ncbi:gamma-aminobutyric acid receptor alpha-like [Symsagittifera roscoffensis]|uniref:gamma-aminobutyric acid receptor alpha-like n=1 Tax=Symsagittifera roscoffensis TaxID=84072 RepID=UPI00307B42FB
MWYPDTYFQLVHSLLYSEEEQSVQFLPNGFVELIQKVRLVTPCTPNVHLFPFDVVQCSLQMSSFGNPIQNVNYSWDSERTPGGVFVDPKNNDADHLGFDILPTGHVAFNCEYGPDTFSCFTATISLKRYYSAYVLQIYVPAFLLVILSWLTFWVNIQATPARASLSVTTVLSMLTLTSRSSAENQKHVSGKVTALDVYIYVCFIFVILAMLEFSLSDFAASHAAKRNKQTHHTLLVNNSSNHQHKTTPRTSSTHWIRSLVTDGENVNKVARVVLPIAFSVFNAIYWAVLTVGVARQTHHEITHIVA